MKRTVGFLVVALVTLVGCSQSEPRTHLTREDLDRKNSLRVLDTRGRFKFIAGAAHRYMQVPERIHPGKVAQITGATCKPPATRVRVYVQFVDFDSGHASHHSAPLHRFGTWWVDVDDGRSWSTTWRVPPHAPVGEYTVGADCFQEPDYLQMGGSESMDVVRKSRGTG